MAESEDFPSQTELDELQELMERVDEPDPRVEKVVQTAAMDREFYTDMREVYQRKAAQVSTKDAYYPYTALNGEFMLGLDPDGHPLGVTRRQLNEHMLVVGRTGAGKTTFFYNVMDTLNEKDVPFLVFDFKNDYRDVAADLDLTVVNWQELKFNPLSPPPGVSDERWAEALAQTWAHSMGFMTLSKSYFLNKLQELYRVCAEGVADGRYPSLFELRDLVAVDDMPYASPRYRAKERTAGRLSMLTGFSGSIFDCSSGYAIEELLDRNVVLELQEPVREVQQFVIETLLTWIFYYREAQDHRDGLRHMVLFDEAKMVFDRQREEDTDIPHPPVTDLMGRIRAFGEGLVVADHEPSKLSDSVKANTHLKLWMSLGSGKDAAEMADTFGIEEDQEEYARLLDRGEAVVKSAGEDPVPINLPYPELDVDTPADELEAGTAAVLDELSYSERVRPDRFLSLVGGDAEDEGQEDAAEDETVGVGDVAERLLQSILDQPFLSMSDRYDAVDAGAKQGNTAKNELLELGLVQEVEVDTKKPGRNPKLLEVTEQGEQWLEENGYDVPLAGQRGLVHRYWQRQVADHYREAGFDVEIEYSVDDGWIDVYAESSGESVAIEVATTPSHEVANVEKCLAAGVDSVEVVAVDEDVRERVEAQLADVFDVVPDNVAVVAAETYA